jgi:hypothetical protein
LKKILSNDFIFFSRALGHEAYERNGVFWDVTLVRTDISEELSASFIRVTRIGGIG